MNQKRSWPGVPNRYSSRWLPKVIRPKSIATVVARLFSTPARSSNAVLTEVSSSSVHSGRTSLIAPTRVVLPAPNPPAMMILKMASGRSVPLSEGAEPMQHLLQQVGAGPFPGVPLPHDRQPALDEEVGEQHPDHTERQRGVGGHVGHGNRLPAQGQDLPVLGAEAGQVGGAAGRGDQDRDQVQHLAGGRLGPAAGQRVGANDRAGIPVHPLAAARVHGAVNPPGCGWYGTWAAPPDAARPVSPASPSRRRPGPRRRPRARARRATSPRRPRSPTPPPVPFPYPPPRPAPP